MKRLNEIFGPLVEHTLPWLVLAFLLIYSYAKFFEHPYQGFKLDPDGRIVHVYGDHVTESALKVGDQIVQIDSIRWDDFRNNLRLRLFDHTQPGQELHLQIDRDNHLLTVLWKLPAPNVEEVLDLLENEGWLALAFWAIGTLTLLVLRPKDERWRLMIGFNYLTAIWLAAGSGVSFYHIWDSAIVLRMAVWLCVPVYLFLGWVFPKPFAKRPTWLVWGAYLLAIAVAIAEWFQIPATYLYFVTAQA